MVFTLTALVITWIESFMRTVGIPGLLALTAVESLGTPPLPSEIILPFAGVMLSESTVGLLGIPFTWETVVVAALAGDLIGALSGYTIGRRVGLSLLRHVGKRVLLSERDIERAVRFFQRRGEIAIFLSRMLPLVRAYISYPAGAGKMDVRRFALFTVLGSFPYTIALVSIGVVLGENFSRLDPYFTVLDVVGVLVLCLLIGWFLWKRKCQKEADRQGQVPPSSAP